MPNGNVFHLAGHLSAHRLVFVTSPRALGQMGWTQAQLAAALGTQTLVVLTDTNGDVVDRANDAAAEFAELRPPADEIDGVVIIGGYDSVPPQRVDPLPPGLRAQVENLSVYDDGQTDSDNYYVWNDDHYVSFDVQKLPDRPVSRIPCWANATANWPQTCQAFVKQQLEAAVPRPLAPPVGAGARASEFAFGDVVYGHYLSTGPGDQMSSAPPTGPRAFADVQSRFLYLVLHGFENNGRYFKGSTGGGRVIELANMAPPAPGASLLADTIFTASCWGALISEFSAKRTDPGDPCGERTPDQSIPIAFLSFGSQGYIGFTGTHHGANTPGEVHIRYHSEPLHETFWERRLRNQPPMPPSPALYQARLDYLAGAPYKTSADLVGTFIPSKDPVSRAVELKTFLVGNLPWIGVVRTMDEELPFDRETPFDSFDQELEFAAGLIEQQLPDFALDIKNIQSPPTRPDRLRVSLVSPTLEELQDYYRLQREPTDPDDGRRTRIYRVYPLRMLEAEDVENDIVNPRHATIVYRLNSNNEVVGDLIGYEA